MASRALTRMKTAQEDEPSKFTVEGYIVIDIGDQRFMLDGTVGAFIDVQYHRSFDDAVAIGTIPDIAATVAAALGIADAAAFHDKVVADIDKLSMIPGLPDALKRLVIKVTDLGINTSTSVYQFGFCCDLSALEIKAGGVQLKGFGMKITYAKTAA